MGQSVPRRWPTISAIALGVCLGTMVVGCGPGDVSKEDGAPDAEQTDHLPSVKGAPELEPASKDLARILAVGSIQFATARLGIRAYLAEGIMPGGEVCLIAARLRGKDPSAPAACGSNRDLQNRGIAIVERRAQPGIAVTVRVPLPARYATVDGKRWPVRRGVLIFGGAREPRDVRVVGPGVDFVLDRELFKAGRPPRD